MGSAISINEPYIPFSVLVLKAIQVEGMSRGRKTESTIPNPPLVSHWLVTEAAWTWSQQVLPLKLGANRGSPLSQPHPVLTQRQCCCSLVLNTLIIGVVPGRRHYETTLRVMRGGMGRGEEQCSIHSATPEPFLEAMKFSFLFNYHQQIFTYSLDDYLLSGSLELHVVYVSLWHRWQEERRSL